MHSPSNFFRLWHLPVLTVLYFLTSALAVAAEFCVRTHDDLHTALSIASVQNYPYTIKIESGVYGIEKHLVFILRTPTTIRGGYSKNCVEHLPGANSLLYMNGNALNLDQQDGDPMALIKIDSLKIYDVGELNLKAGGINPHELSDGTIEISNTVVSGFKQSPRPFIIRSWSEQILLSNVLLFNLPTLAGSNCAVELATNSADPALLLNITAELSSNTDICLLEETSAEVYNSIIWTSDGSPSFFSNEMPDNDSSLFLYNSTYPSNASPYARQTDISTSHAEPLWISPATGDYRLSQASGAVDSGTAVIPGGLPAYDIVGQLRWQGGLPDRGAFESPYNNAVEFVVTSTADIDTFGTLRWAINQANLSPNPATIKFKIDGTCPQTIALTSLLPAITSPIHIDGSSQPGSIMNTSASAFNGTICTVITPASGTMARGFITPASSSGQLKLRGVGMGGFTSPVLLLGGSEHVVAGNQFGGLVGNVYLKGAGLNAITLGALSTGRILIGGESDADKNVISKADGAGISVQPGLETSVDRCQILNNLIGLSPSGTGASPNQTGVYLGGNGCAVRGNRIAANTFDAIVVGGNNNVIQKNKIGFSPAGNGFTTVNTGNGVRVTGTGNVIGSTIAGGGGNEIRFMGVGVRVDSGTANSVRGNAIYDNGLLGDAMDIDLGGDGPTANDAFDADYGPNALQNYPVVQALYADNQASGTLHAVGTLESAAGKYRIEAFYSKRCDGGRGHAGRYAGTTTVTIPDGETQTTFDVAAGVPASGTEGFLSVTATREGNTSELSNCLAVSGAGQQVAQTIEFVPALPTTATVGQTRTVMAESNSNLPVSLDVTAQSGTVCSLDKTSGEVEFLAQGACTLRATQPGNAVYAPAPALVRTIQVVAPTGNIFGDGFEAP